MGNVEGTHRWDEPDDSTSLKRGLPPCGQDFHWRRVGFQHLFDADVSAGLSVDAIIARLGADPDRDTCYVWGICGTMSSI